MTLGAVQRPRTVLLVDDTPDIRELVRLTLELAGGFDVVAESGDGASAITAAASMQPDVVLLDIAMPGMDGLTALPQILEASPGSIVIVVSGFAVDAMAERALAAGAAGYLRKGLNPDELISGIRQICDTQELAASPESPPPSQPGRAEAAVTSLVDDRMHRAILATITEAVVVVRAADRRIIYVNRGAEQLFGYGEFQLAGRRFDDLITPGSAADTASYQRMQAALTGEAGQWRGEVGERRFDGSTVPCLVNVGRLDHPEHGVVWVSVHTDISERREMEAALAAAQRQLRAENTELTRTNEELERFAALIAHDLRTPLATIKGYVQLLPRLVPELDDRARSVIDQLERGAGRGIELVEGLLRYARTPSEPAPDATCDSMAVVADTIDALRAALEAAGADVRVVGTLPVVRAEPSLLGQVVQNLIGNAVKFVAPGVPPVVRISAVREGDFSRFSVADNGIGIEPEQAAAIFRPLHRLHAGRYDGHGLGLAIVDRLVSALGGRVWVEPSLGGSTFHFTVPAA